MSKDPAFCNEITYKHLDKKIRDAKTAKKIFSVLQNGYGPIRQSLLQRGWLEKVPPEKLKYIMGGSMESYMIANMLKNAPVHFIWQPKSRPTKLPAVDPPTLVNSIYRRYDLDFTSKEGLIHLKENMGWYTIENFSDLNVPRTYLLSDREGKESFVRDFKRTKFISFVLFLAGKKNFQSFFTDADDGISTNIIDTALAKVDVLLRIKNHDDIDAHYLKETFDRLPLGRDMKETNMKKIISNAKKFKMQSEKKINEFEKLIKESAEKILEYWPERDYDGFKNLWIVKKVGASCGFGVTLHSDIRDMLKVARMNGNAKYIVQKYIERPMLISNRKSDIRFYFMTLIRDGGFVDLWLYKNCYFKFGTHRFSLDNLDRSIHLTNYTVQKHYMNENDAVENAVENMWDLKEFLRHLDYIEKPNVWAEKIYPAIKQNIIAVVMQSIEASTIEVNNFELNGADFILTYDYQPVLLEVNPRPDLSLSAAHVDLITRQLQEDLVKVLVDFQNDITSSTGDFELAHIFEMPQSRASNDLTVIGTKLHVPVIATRKRQSSRRSTRSKGEN